MWDTLYREVATNIWLSAPKLPGAASLPSRVVRETNTTIKHQVRHCLDSEFRLLLLDQLEALIHLLHDQTDPDTRRDITLQMDAIAKKLRRIG